MLVAEDRLTQFTGDRASYTSSSDMIVRASIDEGAFVEILNFAPGGDGQFEFLQADRDMDGVGDGAVVTDAFQRFAAEIAGTGSLLDLEITMRGSLSDQDYAIDDIVIAGVPAPSDLNVSFFSSQTTLIEGHQPVRAVLALDQPPAAGDVVVRVTSTSSRLDLGSGAGNAHDVTLTGSGNFNVDIDLVDNSISEAEETATLSFALLSTTAPGFSLNPVPDETLRLLDDDPDNPRLGTNNLFTEDFETAGGYTTSISEFSDGSSDYFIRTDGSNISSGVVLNNPQGSFFFAAQDITQALASGTQSPTQTLEITGIDISGEDGLVFSGLFAEDDLSSFTQTPDSTDELIVRARIDGGAFFNVLSFQTGGDQLNESFQLDTDFDGIGDGTALTDDFTRFAAPIAGTGSTLDLQIEMTLNALGDDIAFDDLQITSAADLVATFVSGVDESIEGDVAAQIFVDYASVSDPPALTSLRFIPSSSDIDIGAGPGVSRVLLVGSSGTTITATAVDDAIVEGDETAMIRVELGGSLDPNFTVNPLDVAVRLVDSDAVQVSGAYDLLEESFETDGNGVRYTTSIAEFSDGASDFFGRTNGSGITSNYEVTGEDGSFFFAAQDIDAANPSGSGGSTSATLNFTGIDISGFQNLAFSALFAEDDDGILQDIDAADGLRIRAQIDGGGFTDILRFEAGGDRGNEVAQLDTNFDGVGDGAAITDAFTRYSAAIAGTGSTLDLQVAFEASFDQEDFAIDDIRVTGDAAPDFGVFIAGFTDVFEGGQSETIRAEISGTPDAGDVVRLVASWDPTEYTVNGNATGNMTVGTYLGNDFLTDPDGQIDQVLTITAVDDLDDELLDTGVNQYLTLDVVSADNVELNALAPIRVETIRVWDNDGPTGADPDGAFVLHQEGFETNGAGVRYTLSRAEFDDLSSAFGGDWFTRTTGGTDLEFTGPPPISGTPELDYGIVGGSEGSWFFSVQDPNGPTAGSNSESLTITGIDIAGFENLHFDIDLAEDDQDDGLEDYNASTFFSVEARIDGGGWTEILRIDGTDQTDHEPGLDPTSTASATARPCPRLGPSSAPISSAPATTWTCA
ncbi:MAG: hypothetical protein AAGK00_01110 [Pseudomonadota bacterium]